MHSSLSETPIITAVDKKGEMASLGHIWLFYVSALASFLELPLSHSLENTSQKLLSYLVRIWIFSFFERFCAPCEILCLAFSTAFLVSKD